MLVADRPYAHDACEDVAVFFDPLDPADFERKALMVIKNEDLRIRFITAGSKLVARRREAKPHQRMVDICVEASIPEK